MKQEVLDVLWNLEFPEVVARGAWSHSKEPEVDECLCVMGYVCRALGYEGGWDCDHVQQMEEWGEGILGDLGVREFELPTIWTIASAFDVRTKLSPRVEDSRWLITGQEAREKLNEVLKDLKVEEIPHD